jgi:transcriptional regulator with XRE-family HTH domain
MGLQISEEPISTIRRLRTARGLTQAQVAAEIGYTSSYYALIEREPRLLTRPLARRLAELFSVTPDALYATTETANREGVR